jgi:hypothetical protein
MVSLHGGRLAAGCAAIFLIVLFATQPASRPGTLLRDFNAFYCAGRAISQHADPYHNEPLGRCERSAPRPSFLEHGPAYLSVPAPLPGYALAPFAALALLPYGAAAFLWTLSILASFALTVWRLRELTSLPFSAIVAALALSDAYIGVTLGQIAPVALAAVVNAAWAATRGDMRSSACSAAAATIEPHLGIPACIALALFRPRALAWLLPCGLGLAALSVALLGWNTNVEYVTRVIGAHALSEASNVKQLSLTALLTRLGLDPVNAMRAGELWYVAMIAIGVLLSRRLAQRSGKSALRILLPVAFAMIGGTFVHISQVAAVVPAALVLLDAGRGNRMLSLAVIALAAPCLQFETLGTSFPLLVSLVAGILAAQLAPDGLAWKLLPPLLAFACASLPWEFLAPLTYPGALLASHYDPNALAETSWGAYVGTIGTQNWAAYDTARLPTCLGIAAFASAAIRWKAM